MADEELLNTENEEQENPTPNNSGNGKRKTLISIIVILSILIVIAIILALYFGLRKTDDEQVNPDPEIVEPGPVESDHAWDDGVVLFEPTCTETGLMEYTCTICGATEDVTIPALGHETEGSGYIITEYVDNGVTKGLVEYTCSRCGYEYDQIETLHFSTDTWEEISEYAASGEASSRYYIGETRTMSITEDVVTDSHSDPVETEETIELRIIDFDHDDLSESDSGYNNPDYNNGSNKAAITIETVTLLGNVYSYNDKENTAPHSHSNHGNYGGWKYCDLRAEMQPYPYDDTEKITRNDEPINGTIYNIVVSEDLAPVLRTVDKKTNTGKASSSDADIYVEPETIVVSQDKLFLFSTAEIYSETAISNSTWDWVSDYAEIYNQEGYQYKYYEELIGDTDPNTYCGSLAKYKPGPTSQGRPSDTVPGVWITRNPNLYDEWYIFFIGQAGRVGYTGGRDSDRGISFGFCI